MGDSAEVVAFLQLIPDRIARLDKTIRSVENVDAIAADSPRKHLNELLSQITADTYIPIDARKERLDDYWRLSDAAHESLARTIENLTSHTSFASDSERACVSDE